MTLCLHLNILKFQLNDLKSIERLGIEWIVKNWSHHAGPSWKGLTGCLVLAIALFAFWYLRKPAASPVFATSANDVRSSESTSPEMKEFLENRAILEEKMAQFSSRGTSAGYSMEKFRQQNAELFSKQDHLAEIVAQQVSQVSLPPAPPLQVPASAPPQLQAYMRAKDQLARDQIVFANQHRLDDPMTQLAALQQWQTQNASRIQNVQQLEQALSVKSEDTPLAMPSQPPIISGASPQLKAFVEARNQLMSDRVAYANKHLDDLPPVRLAAMQKWDKQNGDRFRNLQELAEALSRTNQP